MTNVKAINFNTGTEIIKLYQCPSYQGYLVTESGKVFSQRNRSGVKNQHGGTSAYVDNDRFIELSASPNEKGYLQVSVSINGKITSRSVHALVLDAFKGKRPSGLIARHLDGNKRNNTPENLCYGTHYENAQDRKAHGAYTNGGRHHNSKLTNEQAVEIRAKRSSGVKVKDLAAEYKVSTSTIESIIYKKSYKDAEVIKQNIDEHLAQNDYS